MTLTYGQIVIVSEMLDPNGVNPKDRPSVIVTPSNEIRPKAHSQSSPSRRFSRARYPTTMSRCLGIRVDILGRAFGTVARP